jgi:hypothetical protein
VALDSQKREQNQDQRQKDQDQGQEPDQPSAENAFTHGLMPVVLSVAWIENPNIEIRKSKQIRIQQ